MSIIAFLSDFNTHDPYVGVVKGVIARINPHARVIDLTHGIPAHDITAGALTLGSSCRYFPRGTIFLGVVDPGVGSDRKAIVLEHDDYLFVVPDNGIITSVISPLYGHGSAIQSCYFLEERSFFLPAVSSTFHARDIFAPVAAHLSLGVRPAELGTPCTSPVTISLPQPVVKPCSIRGEIIYTDTFGNLITNIPGELLESRDITEIPEETACTARIERNSVTIPVVRTYSKVEPGRGLCIEGGFGLMEIAVNQGNAAEKFQAGRGDAVELIFS